MRTGGLIFVLVAVAVGCGSKDSESGKTGEAPAQGKATNEAAGADKAAGASDSAGDKPNKTARPKAAPDIDDSAAQQVLQAWLAAQNSGDFKAYETLYAKQFYGVKRVGEKKTTFDRKGWLEDRGRMFKKKTVVEADGVTISTSPRSAVVHFTQTWSSGKFRDKGPKQLIVVSEDGQLKISREEMLQSQPAPALAKWVQSAPADSEPIKAAELADDIKTELAQISAGLVGKGEKMAGIQWALPLSKDLVVYEIEVDQAEPTDEAYYLDRGATSNLVVAKNENGRFVIGSVVSEEGVGFELVDRPDMDGDGVGDPVLSWDWYHDHQGAKGIAVVLTKTRTASLLQLSTGSGESGYYAQRNIALLCWDKVDGQLAIAMAYINEVGEPEDEDNPYDSETVVTKKPGFALYTAGPSGVFSESDAYGFWLSEAKQLDGSVPGHGADASTDVPDPARCKAGGTLAVDARATSAERDGAFVISGLSTTKQAAERKAKAAKQPPDRVVKLIDVKQL